MIICLKGRDGHTLYFDVPDRKCGYAAQLVRWSGEIYNLVTPATAPIPTYVVLPPIPEISGKWHCPDPVKAVK